jgi:hypothetical protein
MTWIKPSLNWMMYRSAYGTKPGQERILGIDILRSGFEWALFNSCTTQFDKNIHGSLEQWQTMLRRTRVRVQWDPERTPDLESLPWRTVQVGLTGEAVDAYVDKWITKIDDLTPLVREVMEAVKQGSLERARLLVPSDEAYPLSDDIACRINAG